MVKRISFKNCRDDKNIAEAIAMEKEAVIAAKNAEIDAILATHSEIGIIMRKGKEMYYTFKNDEPVYAKHPSELLEK